MKILQFGEGNFLRCFFDWMVQKINGATGSSHEVILVQPIPQGLVKEIVEAGSYHVLLRGYRGDEYVETLDEVGVIKGGVNPYESPGDFYAFGMDPAVELIVSNTTEAGIFFDGAKAEPHNYPSWLASLLMRRAEAGMAPVKIMPMELNDRSGDLLKGCLEQYGRKYGYGEVYEKYLAACTIYNTLVDRIVPGYPADAAKRIEAKIGRKDRFITSGELFHLFVIEGDKSILDILPFHAAGLNVIVTDDKLDFYHDRKVRILNGCHTSSVPVALLAGIENVDAFASHPEYGKWMSSLAHDEIAFAIDDATETHEYADEVLQRFRNPALGHKFRSIALNSIAKCDARLRPTLESYFVKTGKVPPLMTGAVAKMCEFYGKGRVRDLPNGPLELTDYDQLKGAGKGEMIDSFFPGLQDDLRAALLEKI